MGRQSAAWSKAGSGSHSGPFGSAWAGDKRWKEMLGSTAVRERGGIRRLSGSRSAFSVVLVHLKGSQSASTYHCKQCNILGNKLQEHF